MKKVILFFLTLFVASSVWAGVGDTFTVDDVNYEVTGDSYGNYCVEVYGISYDKQGDIIIPNTVNYNGTNAVTSYTVTSINKNAFQVNDRITSITIPNHVAKIEDETFRHCINLTSVTIPNSVTSIGQMAFRGCTSLTSITIPNNVTFIGDGAFGGCPISTITIPNSVTSISSTAFSSQYITSINVTSGNTKYDSRDNCNAIIETATNTLIMGCKNTEIPNSVTSIGDNAFSGCDVTSITLPNSITSIGKSAFYSCKNLTSLAIPNNVTSIGERAFDGCTSLSSITIPNGVASIGQYAFYECTNLTSITIPNSVTSIGGWAFYNCNGLTSITIPSSVTSIGTCAFQNATNIRKFTCLATNPPTVDKNTFFANPYGNDYYAPCTLLVPCESVENYKSAVYWDKFNSIECLESETVELTKDEVKVEPERSAAVFTMPQNESANSYTLTIQNNGVTFCTLTFNAQGQLSNIDFSTTKSYELKASVSAYQFTVTGLSEATDYGYSFKALASNKSVLKEYTGSFTTKNGDGTGGSSQGGAEVGGGSGQGGEGGEQGGGETTTKYTVSLASNNNAYGSVMGAGEYAEGAKASLIAIPATGFRFVQWNDGNTQNPREITVSANASYVATFEQTSSGDLDYTVTAISANNEQGTVVGGGSYDPLSTVTLAVVPATGYKFVQWNDGNTDNPRVITVTGNCFYVATFEKISTAISEVENTTTVAIINRQIVVNGEAPTFVYTIMGQKIANQNLKSGVYFVNVEGETVKVVK